jgi:hypothetical protein
MQKNYEKATFSNGLNFPFWLQIQVNFAASLFALGF